MAAIPQSSANSGTLYVVATPIGNLADISMRAIETLKAVDLIFAEDTRQTQKLLQHLGFHKALFALHKHNEAQSKHQLLSQLQAGKSVALVSDAGTPLIADPGANVLDYLHAQQIKIEAIPGCCSVVVALSMSGLSADQFSFAGFLPAKSGQRQKLLSLYLQAVSSTVFFETPHRIIDSLADCLHVFGPTRRIFIARELTKLFEESALLSLLEAQDWVRENDYRCRGEFVLVLEQADASEPTHDWQTLANLLAEHEISTKTAAQIVASYCAENKKQVYDYLLGQKK